METAWCMARNQRLALEIQICTQGRTLQASAPEAVCCVTFSISCPMLIYPLCPSVIACELFSALCPTVSFRGPLVASGTATIFTWPTFLSGLPFQTSPSTFLLSAITTTVVLERLPRPRFPCSPSSPPPSCLPAQKEVNIPSSISSSPPSR